MKARIIFAMALTAGLLGWSPSPSHACGGFFCGQQPVDQTAERIVFAVNDDGTVTMIVQIAYQGSAPDFAWVLPLGAVPDVESLDVFPQAALTALDANTGPQFQWPDDLDCYGGLAFDAAGSGPPSRSDGEVTVHIRETVGPFDVAVIESRDPGALVDWLRTNGFRVTSPMEPYIRIYTEEGMKFLALRLEPGRDVSDIEPFMFTLPGQAPSIPLRITALAAEPEMGILVFILGDRRFGPANWPEVEVDSGDIVWSPYTWPLETNWTALVARSVDDAGGRGFVTEMAGEAAPYLELARASTPRDEEQARAQEALIGILDGHRYLTRLYTRLSAEEMTIDPTFRRTAGGDVERTRMLPRYVEGRDMCDVAYGGGSGVADATTPCDFASCGAGGLCRPVPAADGTVVAGCACVPGTTARTTFDPRGRAIVACQDMRMSFLNPGDREVPGATPLPDPCVGFDCGAGGACVAMNMTPTCQCADGLVAIGSLADDGSRLTSCTRPSLRVPAGFYNRRLAALPAELPGGREVYVPPPDPVLTAAGGGCAVTPSPAGASGWLVLVALGLLVARRRRNG